MQVVGTAARTACRSVACEREGCAVAQVMVFENFEIRVAERTVWVQGEVAALGARAFDVLLALAERCDRVVSKAELLDLAWPGLVVEENNLTVQISTLRRVLGHSAIATVTGRGYRLTSAPRSLAAPIVPVEPWRLSDRLERRLVTIVQADVAGWVRLVAANSRLAASAWRRVRTECIEHSLARFGGRPIELTPERLQIEFASAVDAVAWSLELQSRLGDYRRAASADQDPALRMRVGLAVDDVIVDDGKLVGDGVNIAADLQQAAGPDEVLVTQKVRDFVLNKLDASFVSVGERLMRRAQRPMQLFRVDGVDRAAASALVRPGSLARTASVAVLPFGCDGPDTDAYLGHGITEEIIDALSLNRALFVIAHSSTPQLRLRDTDLGTVADELGVRYLVVGTVQRAGSRLRIRASLMVSADQRILWQQRFEGSTGDLFGFQAEIAANVAAATAPHVQDEEVVRARRRPPSSWDAYDCVLRGLAGLYRLGTPEFDNAGAMFQRAIALDPGYAQAHAHLAWWYSMCQFEGRPREAEDWQRLALDHAMEAARLDGRDAWALSVAGYMLTLHKQHDQALDMFDQALGINPSCAAAWARSAATLSYLGRSDASIERVQRAMRLSPFDQHMFWFQTICGGACFVARRYDEAAGWLGKALRLNPRFNGARRVQIATLVRTGEIDEARALAQELLAECPDFSVARFGRLSPMQPPYLDDLLQGLREAGLPD